MGNFLTLQCVRNDLVVILQREKKSNFSVQSIAIKQNWWVDQPFMATGTGGGAEVGRGSGTRHLFHVGVVDILDILGYSNFLNRTLSISLCIIVYYQL